MLFIPALIISSISIREATKDRFYNSLVLFTLAASIAYFQTLAWGLL